MTKQMNNLAKRTVLRTLFGTVLLLLGLGLYLYYFAKTDEAKALSENGQPLWQSSVTITVFIICLLALGAFLLVLYKKVRKDNNVQKLNAQFDLAYEQLIEYVGVSGLSLREKKDLSDEILSLFLEAQKNGKDLEQVTGNDYKSFIDEMINAYGVKRYHLLDFFSGMQFFIFYLVSVQGLYYFENPHQGFFRIKLHLSLILFFFLSAFVLIPLIYQSRRNEITGQKGRSKVRSNLFVIAILFLVLFIVSMEVATRFFAHVYWISVLLHSDLAVINSPFVLALLLLLLPVLHYIKKRLRKWF